MSGNHGSEPRAAREHRGLRASIAATATLGAVGIAWGLAGGSQMILLDGAYGLLGIVLSVLLLRAAKVARAEPTATYPYGKASATPMAVGLQGLVMLGTLAYAGIEAVAVIRGGGSDVAAGPAVLYGVLATVSCTVVWRWLEGLAGSSDVLRAEAAAWRVGAFRGAGMIVGFGLVAVLAGSSWRSAVPYLDPGMVLLTCVAFAPIPARMVRATVRELLDAAPDDEVHAAIQAAVDDVAARFGFVPDLAASKVGPRLYVEVNADVDPSVTIAEEQDVRDQMRAQLDDLPYEVWLNVELHPRR